MKVLVTGGNGWIGGYVCEKLASLGHEPVVFDRYRGEEERKDRPYALRLGDVRDYGSVYEAIYNTDAVIHLAGILGTQETLFDPMPSIDVNITGSMNVFRVCHRLSKKAVHITVGNHFMNNPYSISRAAAERLALMMNKEHGTRIAIVRGFNAYGPKQKAGPVRKIMPNFILPALKGQSLTIYGDGSQVMDMIYVEDLAEILCRALLIDHGVYDQVFEAGTGARTTVNDIADEVIRQVGNGDTVHVPMRPGEVAGAAVVADPSTLAPLLRPREPAPWPWLVRLVSLAGGIGITVPWYREQLKASRKQKEAYV